MNMKNLIKSVLVVAVIAGVFLKTGDVFGVCSAVLRYGSECTCTGWIDGDIDGYTTCKNPRYYEWRVSATSANDCVDKCDSYSWIECGRSSPTYNRYRNTESPYGKCDCNDNNSSMYPDCYDTPGNCIDENCNGVYEGVNSLEICGNGIDDNCSGQVDENCEPSATIARASGQASPTKTGPVNFTVTFERSVTGFDSLSDVLLGGTAGANNVTITGSGATYNVAVSGMSSDGTVDVSVKANVAKDSNNMYNKASGSASVNFDSTAPRAEAHRLILTAPRRP